MNLSITINRYLKSIIRPQMDLDRFIKAQDAYYQTALSEIQNGRKRSHWMWYIFPQIKGLGMSETSKFYAIQDLNEAEAFIGHPILGSRLLAISEALLNLTGNNALEVFGSPDDMKLKSSMTLFVSVQNAHPVFQAVLDKFFKGEADSKTLQALSQNKDN